MDRPTSRNQPNDDGFNFFVSFFRFSHYHEQHFSRLPFIPIFSIYYYHYYVRCANVIIIRVCGHRCTVLSISVVVQSFVDDCDGSFIYLFMAAGKPA